MSDQWGQQPSWGPESWGQSLPPNQQSQGLPPFPNQPQWQPQSTPSQPPQGPQSIPDQPQWGQPLMPNQQQWGQPPTPGQQPWGQPPIPNQQQWQPQSAPNQQQWGQTPLPNQQQWQPQPAPNQQQWGQPLSNAGWQQQPFNPGQFQSPPPKKKKNRVWLILGIIVGILVLCGAYGIIGTISSKASNTGNIIPTPTETAAQVEGSYEASTTSTTVINLDKDGSANQGEAVNFMCEIINFVKDSSGMTAGANVFDPSSGYTSVIQVIFPTGIDLTQLNQGDTLEVWGNDQGAVKETNAFGATIQEVVISAKFINDQTTNYQAVG